MRSPDLIDFAVTRVFHAPWQTPGPVTQLIVQVEALEVSSAGWASASALDAVSSTLAALSDVVTAALTDYTVLDRLLVDSSGDVVSDSAGDVLWN
jgi:hypothetical protein